MGKSNETPNIKTIKNSLSIFIPAASVGSAAAFGDQGTYAGGKMKTNKVVQGIEQTDQTDSKLFYLLLNYKPFLI